MSEDEIDMLAWDAIRTLRDRYIGRKGEPTDEDWHEVIAAALLRVTHDDQKSAENWYANGYDDGFGDRDDGKPHKFEQQEAAA
jgi:hypothetical protein